MDTNTILALINTGIAIAAFLVVLFGIKLGRRAMFKSETLFGKQAEDRYNFVKSALPKDSLYYEGPYEGGLLTVPQFKTERFYYDSQTMGSEWNGIAKLIHYYWKEDNKIMGKSWRLKG